MWRSRPTATNPRYHGWLFGFDTTKQLAQVAALNATPESSFGGIWGGGAAPAVDSDGTLLIATGNAAYDPLRSQWGDTMLKRAIDRPGVADGSGLPVLDHFTPFNQELLGTNDLDLGSGGVMLIPEQPSDTPFVAVTGGKQGLVYLLNRDQLTDGNRHHRPCSDEALEELASARLDFPMDVWTDTCDPILQAFKNPVGRTVNATLASSYRGPGIFSTPAYWNGFVYLGAANDNLKCSRSATAGS